MFQRVRLAISRSGGWNRHITPVKATLESFFTRSWKPFAADLRVDSSVPAEDKSFWMFWKQRFVLIRVCGP